MITLHEIEPGIWIVPELVIAVSERNGFVVLHLIGGGEVRLNAWGWNEQERIVIWIDARRIEPLAFVARA